VIRLIERQAPLSTYLAQVQDTTTEWKQGAGNVLFLCAFLVGLIVVAVWWLRRG
jgi:hypothetical protein